MWWIKCVNLKIFERPVQTKHIDSFVTILIFFPGNALINVGPTKEGIIPPIFKERLLLLGGWLAVNGEAIYGTSPWYNQHDSFDTDVWYTCKKNIYEHTRVSDVPRSHDQIVAVYAIFFRWPKNNSLKLKVFENSNMEIDYSQSIVSKSYSIYLLNPENLYDETNKLRVSINALNICELDV